MTTNSKPLPSRTYLRECFEYDLISGEAYWLERPIDHFNSYRAYVMWNSKFSFGRIRNLHKQTGYIHTKINNESYTLHRLIWKWWYGNDPEQIDHIDRNRTNNRIINLRSVSQAQNAKNKGIYKNNKSGFSGVDAYKDKWIARIYIKTKTIHIGIYDTPKEAAKAIEEFYL